MTRRTAQSLSCIFTGVAVLMLLVCGSVPTAVDATSEQSSECELFDLELEEDSEKDTWQPLVVSLEWRATHATHCSGQTEFRRASGFAAVRLHIAACRAPPAAFL